MSDLSQKKCVSCEGGMTALGREAVDRLLPQVPGWEAKGLKLSRKFKFKDFIQAMSFINKMAAIAEEEAHHPDFLVHYNEVSVTLWTHVVNGLTENDFIVAAKINEIV